MNFRRMALSNYGLKEETRSSGRENYDRLLSVFHTGSKAKLCLLETFFLAKDSNLLDWLSHLGQHFLQSADVQRALRKSSIIQVTDLEPGTVNTILQNTCFDMFWDVCLKDTTLEDTLNSYKDMLYQLYQRTIKQHTSLSTEHYTPSLTKTQWEFLFKTDDLGQINEGENYHANKDVTIYRLDNSLNFLLLYITCPLFKSVNAVSECQSQITKIAILQSELETPVFDDVWVKIETHIATIGRHCNLSEYFKFQCASIQQSKFNRELTRENRKCILEEAFKNPSFIMVCIF